MQRKSQGGAGSAALEVAVVDDHPLSRRGLISLLECDERFHVCGEAADAAGLDSLLDAQAPQLVLLDLSLGGDCGMDLIAGIRRRVPECRVLVVSMHEEALYESQALDAGADGYVSKSEGPDRVLEAARRFVARPETEPPPAAPD